MPVLSLLLLSLSTALLLSLSQAASYCRHNHHCDDGDAATHDICLRSPPLCVSFPRRNHKFSVRQSMDTVTPIALADLIEEVNAASLPLADKKHIVAKAIRVFSEVTPHRFLQLNIVKYDVVEALKQFSETLDDADEEDISNFNFHARMKTIFSGMNDRHSTYFAPPPLGNVVGFLGFLVSKFFVDGDNTPEGNPRRRYVVNNVVPDFTASLGPNSTFQTGVEILTWDGVDINRVVEQNGRDSYGSNQAAQIDLGILRLTVRRGSVDAIPIEPAVIVGYLDAAGNKATVELPWTFFTPNSPAVRQALSAKSSSHYEGHKLGSSLPLHGDNWHPMLAREDWVDDKLKDQFNTVRQVNFTRLEVNPQFEDLFSAVILKTPVATIGGFSVLSFNSQVTGALINELTRVLKLLPPTGLVVDLRGNPGGNPNYVKTLVELISGVDVEDQPLSLRATSTMDEFASAVLLPGVEEEQEDWLSTQNAIRTARLAGEQFSGPILNLYRGLDKAPQAYFGPIATLVDGVTYSAGDLFAAIQVDRNVSTLIGVSDNVGAGGATVTLYSELSRLVPEIFEPIPGDVDFTSSLFRFYRTGAKGGAIVENFGVKPHVRYFPTKRDALPQSTDLDLIDFVADMLVSKHLFD